MKKNDLKLFRLSRSVFNLFLFETKKKSKVLFLLILLLPVASVTLISCEDEDEVISWECAGGGECVGLDSSQGIYATKSQCENDCGLSGSDGVDCSDYNGPEGDPQVSSLCLAAWQYACAGEQVLLEETCENYLALGNISDNLPDCPYCDGSSSGDGSSDGDNDNDNGDNGDGDGDDDDDDDSSNNKGKVTFWTATDGGCGDIIVSVDGEGTGSITGNYENGISGCDVSAGANFTLDPGSYSYTASPVSCDVFWEGDFDITSNGCLRYELLW